MTQPAHEAKCPHPDCDGVLRISDELPAGEYPCKCHACTVKLSWAVYLGQGSRPYLALVEKTEVSGE